MSKNSSETALYPVKKLTFMWKISNFSYCTSENIGEVIQSSTFPMETVENEKWCLRIYPNGLDEESKDYISLHLMLLSSKRIEVRAKFKLSLINSKNEKTRSMKTHQAYQFFQGKDWGYRKFIRKDYLFNPIHQLLPQDILSISCQISVLDLRATSVAQTSKASTKLADLDLSKDLDLLFKNQNLTDVIMCVEGKEIKAHKAILASRSLVFQAMFQHEMEERLSNRVEIPDIKFEVFKELLNFIYTDKCENLNLIANDLLVAADKYCLDRLKILCEEALVTNLSVNNSAEILILADLHCCPLLKVQTIDFIITYAKSVMETTGWKAMEESHPYLIAEAFQELVKRHIK